jgi:hypothetical protein
MFNFVFAFAALATALPCLTPNATTPPDGRWLTSATLSQDSSGNGKTLTMVGTGTVTWNSSSASGVTRGLGAFANFNGTGGLQIANGNEPTNIDAQDFAVSFWIRLPGGASKPCYHCPIVGQRLGCDGDTNWVVWFRGDAFYMIRFEMRNTVMPTGRQALEVDVDATLKDTQWHFIVAFREGATLKLAVDGNVVGEQSFPSVANLSQPRQPLAIGYWNQSCGDKDFFSGQLADVRLFVRKLPLCNAPATTTTSASQTTSIATTSASQTTSVAMSSTQMTAPASVTTQTSVTGTTSVVPNQTTAPASDGSTTGETTAQVRPTPSEPDSQIGAIIGGSVAGGALVIAAILAIVCFHHRRRNVPPKNNVEKANANIGGIYDKVPVSQYDHGNLQPPPIYDQGNLS